MALSHAVARQTVGLPDVKTYARIPQVLDVPNLIQSQLQSYDWLKTDGLQEVYQEISPIADYTSKKYELHFLEHYFKEAKYTPQESKEREITFCQPLYVKTRLLMKDTGEIKEQEIFMGDIPMMTSNGTFIINGAERVVVSQLVRSPGIYFVYEKNLVSDRNLCFAKLIPSRGAWLEFETSNKDVISVKVDRKRKVSATTFLRALGVAADDEMMAMFEDVDTDDNHRYMQSTLDKDPVTDPKDLNFKEEDLRSLWEWLRPEHEFNSDQAKRMAAAQIEFYRRLRPGEPPSLENSRNLIRNLFFGARRYDLGRVGRFKLNRRLSQTENADLMTLSLHDVVAVIRTMIRINQGDGRPDDIDHLGNRRVRAVGELVQNQVRVGLLRMERMVKEKMTLVDPETAAPQGLVNIRPVVAAVREFFGGSQLSQFMDQTNPLAELTHKRRLSALGPGGLSRERAGFDVRDVHFSHYGRICPIETPEGPNIGLLSSLASYARINEFGFIESPYRRVIRTVTNDSAEIEGRLVNEDVLDEDGKVILGKGRVVNRQKLAAIRKLPAGTIINVRPFVASVDEEVQYLSADQEENFRVAQANSRLDSLNQFMDDRVEVRVGESYTEAHPDAVDYIDVSPMQIMSVSAALIPFLEHDDANRALMGSNMQRQAVPLLRPQAPVVGTGIESRVARDSGQMVLSLAAGHIKSVGGREIIVTDAEGNDHVHPVIKFARTNQGTCFDQRPIVAKGDLVERGSILADSSSTDHGELALGQNVLVAFMSWEGYNYEDAIILSERLVKEDYFSSTHIEKHEMEARETKLGPEEITRDIPNVGEASLRDLDERGIICVGAEVGPGDILVGKVTPKGETELTAEEKLLRAIFGEKSRDVKDTSLRVPHGERGKIIEVKVLNRANRNDLPPGVNEAVRVWIAQTRKISVGDKMAGRHGNKGVVSRILPEEDMPFLTDGTPVDIILNPIGVPSRMNLGQVLETHLGWAARGLNFRANTPVFDGAKDISIEDALARVWFAQKAGAIDAAPTDAPELDPAKLESWLSDRGLDAATLFDDSIQGAAQEACLRIWLADEANEDPTGLSLEQMHELALDIHHKQRIAPPTFGKFELIDGRSGESFDQLITVGSIYILKLIHLVEDKIHARSTGPYSMITQQPLGGKAQFGGQRFGEMEVWALEAYSAAYNLQEVLTVKSDDVAGRVKTYEAVVKGEPIGQPGVPESFNVLLKELQSLGLSVELLNEDERPSLTPGISDDIDLYQPLEAI
ncbi:MAG: DNA-directed RNA polymerase subunit beta [SAR202 cluster bacterium Io17-Chloro-G7]|nr:MAG: DNA-directed RNA polymerase subunit beta [SAR202 cluster bacterium Io17-Chloro-G7]